jgi:hypothetical protein
MSIIGPADLCAAKSIRYVSKIKVCIKEMTCAPVFLIGAIRKSKICMSNLTFSGISHIALNLHITLVFNPSNEGI